MSWFSELKRRNVFRVAAAYAVVAWVLLQIADVVFPALQMPDWTLAFVSVVLALGFPIALVLAWAYDLTPEGIERTTSLPLEERIEHSGVRRVDFGLAALLGIAVTWVLVDNYYLDRANGSLVDANAGSDAVRPAIAVLPFESLGGGTEQQIFVDGLADDLITRLSSWRTFPVIARTATFSPDLPTDLRAMSEYLDARYVVEGTVREVGDRIRLVVRLADASTGESIWSEQFDRSIGDVLLLQDEITSEIVRHLNPALLDAESRRASRADPSNLDAWTAAQAGWWHVNRENAESYVLAHELFEQAIELDPNWGWPHAALALTHYRELLNGWSESRAAAVVALGEHAEIAINLDPMDSFAHHALGHWYATSGRIEESLAAFARGVELNPSDAMASSCFGMQLAGAGRGQEAVDYATRAIALSPNDPWEHRFTLVLARGHFSVANYSESESWADRSLQLRPSSAALWHSVSASAHSGGLERAGRKVRDARSAGPLVPIEQIERGLSSSTDPEYIERLIRGLVLAGYDD